MSDDLYPSPTPSASIIPQRSKRGLFGRKQAPRPTTYSEKLADQALDVTLDSSDKDMENLTPASFLSMFR
jgi:hypothetical protein